MANKAKSRQVRRNWYVYILRCKRGLLYTGITDNIEKRFEKHRQGRGGKFTRAFKPVKVLFTEQHPTRSSALKREAQIKQYRRKEKLSLIQGERG